MATIGNKIAVIVNGDTEPRHLGNAERSYARLREAGYEVFVLNPRPIEGAAPDHYFPPTRAGLRILQERLKFHTGPETDLAIVTTGHGDRRGEVGTLCLQDGCDADTVVSVLDTIPYHQRFVYMDQCYSGNWSQLFLDDPKTLFVSAGSKDEIDACQEIAPLFWGQDVPDLNQDGVISWQERYAHAFPHVNSSTPQFVPSVGFRLRGEPPFEPRVVEVGDANQLRQQLQKLQSGQYAIIAFSTKWCGACEIYRPTFDRQAREGGGQHLWLRTDNSDLAEEWGIEIYPTVMIVDDEGQRMMVLPMERDNVERALAEFEIPPEVRLMRKLEAALAAAYLQRGYRRDVAGRHEEAIADYTQAIRYDSNNAAAYHNRGIAKLELGRYEEAIADYTQAIRLDPNYALAYNNRGLAKAKLGRYRDAREDFTFALRLEPANRYIQENLAAAKGYSIPILAPLFRYFAFRFPMTVEDN